MYLKKKEKKKKSLNRAAFSRQRGFFFSFWQRALGAKPRSYLSAVWHQGRPTCVSRPSRDPWLMARHWVVLILSVGRVWHFIHNSVKKKAREKAGEGRKVCVTGREETKGDPRARLYCGTWLDYTWAYCAACCCWKSQQQFLLLSMGEEWLLIYFHVRQNNAHTGGTMLPFRHSWERGLPKK